MFVASFALRKSCARLFAVAALFLLAACELPTLTGTSPATGSGPTIDPGQTVQVALLVPKSDPDPGFRRIAQGLENAARLALAETAANIDLRVYDTAGVGSTAGAQARRAVDEGAVLILGPLRSESANAAAVAVAADNVNVLSFSNTTTIAGGNLFLLGDTFENTARRLVGYAAPRGTDRIAILHTSDVPGQWGRNAIQQAAVAGGAQVVASEGYELTTASLNAALSRLAPVFESGGANGLFLTDNWDAGLAVVLQLAPEQGIAPGTVRYVGLSRWDVRSDGFNLPGINGGLFARPSAAMQTGFAQRYNSAYNAEPHPLAALGFDAASVVAQVLATGRRDAFSATVLTRSSGFSGSLGPIRLRGDRTADRALEVATIRNRQVEILDPAPTSFRGGGS